MLLRQRVFLDTSFIIALSNARDPLHAKAKELDAKLSDERVALVLHNGILFEIGDGFARLDRRQRGMQILQGVLADESYVVVETTDEIITAAISLFASRPDKEWGLTDCISFTIMDNLRMTEALTADMHFTQAGFKALLLD